MRWIDTESPMTAEECGEYPIESRKHEHMCRECYYYTYLTKEDEHTEGYVGPMYCEHENIGIAYDERACDYFEGEYE